MREFCIIDMILFTYIYDIDICVFLLDLISVLL